MEQVAVEWLLQILS